MSTVRLTMAQALVRFLANQYVERDGVERRFFAGCFGIFGHGNVAGVGQALLEYSDDLTYYQSRNEQAMVHTATAYARQKNRLQTMACTSSIGPGATNMVTGAALATINRLPVLLLPGDVFASRGPDPVLQQLETPHDGDLSVNDAFRPVSKYWDRIERPEQIIPAALAAMRVLTSPAETGTVTLALPQDVQVEAYDYPDAFFEKRVWRVTRPVPDAAELGRAGGLIRGARRPMIVAGGGVIYSQATEAFRALAERTGIPVGETQAGKGSMPYDHPLALGAVGATGTFAANRAAREADVVIGVGTRWSDFTTASKSAFQNPEVRFVNVNVADFDAAKHAGVGLVGDARTTLEALDVALAGYEVEGAYREQSAKANAEWDAEVQRLYALDHGPLPAQSEIIGTVNTFSEPEDVVVCAAGSMPGDLHKLWRTRDPKGYHVEYGYSCMGYEIAGGLGIKMAAPEREVYVMVGDGSYLMMNAEIVTSIQEDRKLTIVLVDNSGFSSIGSLSRSVGAQGFGTQYRYRKNGSIGLDTEDAPGDVLPVDLAANAESLGAYVIRAKSVGELKGALAEAKDVDRTVVIHIPVDRYEGVPDYESFWDVPVAEVSEMETVRSAYEEYAANKQAERRYLQEGISNVSDLVVSINERPDEDGSVVKVTPESAGWEYVGFEVLRLAEGRTVERRTDAEEVCLVVLEGYCNVSTRDDEWRGIGGRDSVFEGLPYAVYLPPGTDYTVEADSYLELAVCSAPTESNVEPFLVRPEDIEVEVRGSGNAERRIHPILMDDRPAERLLVVEVLTPKGHWSSYPPHKHDQDDLPNESYLEETYYHKVQPPQGFAFQRVYTEDRSLDETMTVRDDDTVLVPRGYHAVSAPPGYDLYYLNVMAGPVREWKFKNDPDHDWLMG